ncbi:MAG: LPS export ABC transporter permease LptG [Stenotrophobium sp.]
MKIIGRYIILHILGFTAITGLALVAIYSFIGFVSGVGDTGVGSYGVFQLMVYTLLQMPAGVYTLLPIIAMLGTLMGLGTLAAQSELTAMRAAGVSLMRIGGATLLAGLLLGIFGLMLGDWIAPAGNSAAETYRTVARTGASPGLGGEAVWLRDGDNIFHIQRLLADDHIADVEEFTLAPDMSLLSASHIDEGRYQKGHWLFTGVSRTDLSSAGTATLQLPQLQWGGTLSPEVLKLFVLESESLTMPGLVRLIRYLKTNGLDTATYRLALWRKLVAPFTVMAMMLFAVPFVLGSLRSSGAGQRLLIGILVGVGFYVLNEVSANLGEIYKWPPVLAAALPSLLLGGAAIYRLSRVR